MPLRIVGNPAEVAASWREDERSWRPPLARDRGTLRRGRRRYSVAWKAADPRVSAYLAVVKRASAPARQRVALRYTSRMPQVQVRPFSEGEEVWLPVSEVRRHQPDFEPYHGGAMVAGKLAGRVGGNPGPFIARTWNVDVAGLTDAAGIQRSVPVSSRRFRRHAKILILRIGDWETEQPTLNPLAASLKAQLSLLLPPSDVDVEYIRTLEELGGALRVHGGGLTPSGRRQASPWGYAVLVGHGRSGTSPAIRFGNSWHAPKKIARSISGLGPGRRTFAEARFISLCCETGDQAFAQAFSDELNTTWVGPGRTVHSFEAAGFVQRLFFESFLAGRTWSDAFRCSRAATTSFSTSFRCWLDGEEVASDSS